MSEATTTGKMDDLAAQAALLEAPTTGEPGSAGSADQVKTAQPLIDGETMDERNTRAIGCALALLREGSTSVLNPPMVTLEQRMPDDVIEKIAAPWAKVFTHYKIDLMGSVGHPAIEAAIVTAPVLWGIGIALQRELSERAKGIRRAKRDTESGD